MTRSPDPTDNPECALTVEDARLLVHELRAPMTAIVGYAGMLRNAESAQERTRIIDGLERAIVRMDAMLQAASLGAFKPKPNLGATVSVDVCMLAREAADDIRVSSAIALTVDCKPSPPVIGDALLLRRVLDNLLSNAERYGAGRPVDLRVAPEGTTVVIEVSDRGPGIPEKDRERVLRPLERLERDAGVPGTGLGLSIAADIARTHGGVARVLGREGGGTTVRVELPAAR